MSASQAAILDFINLRVGNVRNIGVGAGLSVRGHVGQVIGMNRSQRAATSDAPLTVEAVAVVNHKWAVRVGKYNDNTIWAEVFQNVQENRRRLKEQFNDLE